MRKRRSSTSRPSRQVGPGGTGKGEAWWAAGRQLTGLARLPRPRQAVDPMRAAYLDDLRSKFLLENSVLKMEYAEVRVLHLGHKVGTAVRTFPGPSPCWPSLPPHPLASSCVSSMGSAEALSLVSPYPWLWPSLRCLSGLFS